MTARWTVGVTGSPGTGKKSVSPLVAGGLGAKLVDLNAVALARPGASRNVDVRMLRSAIQKVDLGRAVIFGHLLPHVLRKGEVDFVAVLRCEPAVLKRRLLARGYPDQKVVENVEAELIGLVLDESIRAFGAEVVCEYDTTRGHPAEVSRDILKDTRSPRRRPWIDWTLRYDSSAKLRSLLSAPSTDAAST